MIPITNGLINYIASQDDTCFFKTQITVHMHRSYVLLFNILDGYDIPGGRQIRERVDEPQV